MLKLNELSKAQKVFKKAVDTFAKKYDSVADLPYYFHNESTVSVDGYLHQILNHNTEFNFGNSLRDSIEDDLFKIDIFLESINGCDFAFYKI